MTPCPSAGGADCNKAGETLGVLPAPWRPGRWSSRPHRSSVKVTAACTPGPVTGPPRATRALGGIAALGSCAAAAACGDVAATEDCACSRPSGGLKAAEPSGGGLHRAPSPTAAPQSRIGRSHIHVPGRPVPWMRRGRVPETPDHLREKREEPDTGFIRFLRFGGLSSILQHENKGHTFSVEEKARSRVKQRHSLAAVSALDSILGSY
ncbi:uncharacterized protein LOC128316027 [Acinonyx jubatus]|uniref:Uncharacterized protein LOC128316027 n=1 Tax=Acinonyx jubatus TaxID=32536 RepID=A0ABM3Q8Y6_ACIJB|nr:uncharacterized protein LOC128316027 [Acinonyx jubatus]